MEARVGILTTASLCLCMLTHSYLLISVFPYSGFMVIELVASVDEENAGKYAGLVSAAFMIGRALTSFVWGIIADTYGRTTVLLYSLVLSCVLSVLFGLAPTFVAAVIVRFCLGLANGIMSAIKTIVSELSGGDEKREATMMGQVIGMWGFGFLISPAVSGMLAEPIKQYPDRSWLQEGFLGATLQKHPFLLPNLLGAAMCVASTVMLAFFVPETLPVEIRRSPRHIPGDAWRRLCSWLPPSLTGPSYSAVPVLKTHDSAVITEDDENDSEVAHSKQGDQQKEEDDEEEDSSSASPRAEVTMASLLRRPNTRILLAIYWAYSFVGLTVDEVFPLFCLSHQAGFGITEKEIGKVLSLCGFLFVICQYPVYSYVYGRLGLLGSVRLGSLFSAPLMFLIPLSLLLNMGAEAGSLKWATMVFLGVVLATHRIFSFCFFTSISVMTNRIVPTSQRATMNGISNLGGSGAKGLGPIFAGFLVSISVAFLGKFGALMMYGVVGCLGLCVTFSSFLFLQQESWSENDDNEDETQEIEFHKVDSGTDQDPLENNTR